MKISRGLKQGDELASTLFNKALEDIIKNLSENNTISASKQIGTNNCLCGYKHYDINIMTRKITTAKEIFTELKDKEVGLSINMEKTKKLSQTRRRRI